MLARDFFRGSKIRSNDLACPIEPEDKPHQLTNTDSTDAAQRLYEGVRNAGMAIWRQHLQRLQPDCGPHDDHHHKQDAARVAQSEGDSDQEKCREMFKLRVGE